MWSFLQLILGSYLGPASRTIFALLGAIVFSAYIVLDTENLIAKHDLDDYVAASLSLYLVSPNICILWGLQGISCLSQHSLLAFGKPHLCCVVLLRMLLTLPWTPVSLPSILDGPIGDASQPANLCLASSWQAGMSACLLHKGDGERQHRMAFTRKDKACDAQQFVLMIESRLPTCCKAMPAQGLRHKKRIGSLLKIAAALQDIINLFLTLLRLLGNNRN